MRGIILIFQPIFFRILTKMGSHFTELYTHVVLYLTCQLLIHIQTLHILSKLKQEMLICTNEIQEFYHKAGLIFIAFLWQFSQPLSLFLKGSQPPEHLLCSMFPVVTIYFLTIENVMRHIVNPSLQNFYGKFWAFLKVLKRIC